MESAIKKKKMRQLICYGILLLLAGLFLFPLYWFVLSSLKSYEQIFSFPPKFFIWPLRFENYPEAYAYPALQFAKMLKNSTIITGLSIIGAVISSTVVAYAFSRVEWRGRDTIFLIVILTMIIPVEVVITPQYLIYSKLHLLDTWIPLIMPFFCAKPFYIFMIRQTMMGIDRALDEAAEIDGCNTWKKLVLIIIPQSKPALVAVGIMVLQDQWNSYIEPLVFVNSNAKQTISVGLSLFTGMYNIEWNLVFAAAVIVALPILIIFMFMQNYFIQGVVVSGVKG